MASCLGTGLQIKHCVVLLPREELHPGLLMDSMPGKPNLSIAGCGEGALSVRPGRDHQEQYICCKMKD